MVLDWNALAQDTVGKQLIRAADSVGANMAEGAGRYSLPEEIRFFIIARGSARETRYWINRAKTRRLLAPEKATELYEECEIATRQLNALIARRRTQQRNYGTDSTLREPIENYQALTPNDPMTQ
ncbi:MAG: hypothetical protein OHK0029_34520 [Armatimonadaceae bacterium]